MPSLLIQEVAIYTYKGRSNRTTRAAVRLPNNDKAALKGIGLLMGLMEHFALENEALFDTRMII
jgi:hypothetical protein